MAPTHSLIEHLAPDCIKRLQRAARMRFEEAGTLQGKHPLAAVYWYGYSVEMCLVAAYFRNAGMTYDQPIDRGTRMRHMANARQRGLMQSDPHPLPGWAKLLLWQASTKTIGRQRIDLLNEAVCRADAVYRHWRPELRYKVTNVEWKWLDEVRHAAEWFVNNQSQL